MATQTVHVVDSPLSASLTVSSGLVEHAPVAGQPATVTMFSTHPGAKYEFDLDGDGTYELDNGTTGEVTTTFSAGTHVVGARMTDTSGGVAAQRNTILVYQPADAPADRFFVQHFKTSATVGLATDLTIDVDPYTYDYTIEWDADGDGAFDDGTFTTPGGVDPNSSRATTRTPTPLPASTTSACGCRATGCRPRSSARRSSSALGRPTARLRSSPSAVA